MKFTLPSGRPVEIQELTAEAERVLTSKLDLKSGKWFNKINEPVYTFRYGEDQDGYLQSFRISSKAEKGKGTGRGTEAIGIDPMKKELIQEGAKQ